jgi:guanylate kinase
MKYNNNKVIIVSAPSGAGKTTLVKHLLESFPQLEFSISATSRKPRQNEKDGIDYYFISVDEFKKRINNNEFIEWEEVYPNCYYGTLKSEIHRIWEKNKVVLFDVDVKGGINLKKIFNNNAISIFIAPPDLKTLEKRLINRGTETNESIKTRLEKASYEMNFKDKFDYIIINDNLDTAKQEIYSIVYYWLNN